MAKATRLGGISIAGVDSPTQRALSRRPSIGGAVSVGGNFTLSSESEERSELDENLSPREPAQTTDNRSSQTRTEPDSDANSTDGATRVTQNPRSARKSTPAKKTAAKKAAVRSADGDSDDEFDEPVDLSGSEEDEFK
jgi:hypothetical protein